METEYIMCAFLIIFTFLIVYNIDTSFEYNPKRTDDVEFNIFSDYIIVLVKENCPYCEELEEKIVKSDKKYTVVRLTGGMTFEFDNAFTNLQVEERNNIIKETQKVFIPGQTILFPTIITKDNTYSGLPGKEIIYKLFNI